MKTSPPDLVQDDKSVIVDQLDQDLNNMMLQALLHSLYTGIVAVTLWIISSSPKHLCSTFLRTIIITLFILLTIPFRINWALECHAFIEHGNNYYSRLTVLLEVGPWWKACFLANRLTGSISTFIVDLTIIWCCWVLWECQWRVIFVPMVCAVVGMVMKVMQMVSAFHGSPDDIHKTGVFAAQIDWSLIYIFLTLATTVLCMVLIIYRIVWHAPRMSATRRIIEMLIESNLESANYADIIAMYVKVITPTLLVGRVSAHANANRRREQMVAMWENHPPLVSCFREEGTDNGHRPDDGHQTASGLSDKEMV
ncbi:uncharacterized protein ARMOST_22376 [Armillaria ostoyae]|uniref:Uncharacterized protein n=1 Tax=Armillaria ostoyae TaxID=47428 RepID=A0A284SCP9_ARMOS|nr:uncharacterized protein ARMOST_22376 [Armillaria ostoyae]